ncbi:VOC family protein [Piscibacillus sp. B03]|uniref:VOC family protein n=1 Tax=Piscibacillus sp. B03 TaxID=3457430 RepID=UPI003FCD2F1C
MIFEMTMQVRVPDYEKGLAFYEVLFGRKPDFIPHEGFAEWEVVPGSWIQVGEGEPLGSGPIRFGVPNIEEAKARITKECSIEEFDIHTREGVPAKWGTFQDPWGNKLGFFEYLDKAEEKERIEELLGDL